MKKKKRIPLDEEANGLEKSKYRLAASPFPAIATKKEETCVAEEGCVSLIAVRKAYTSLLQRRCASVNFN